MKQKKRNGENEVLEGDELKTIMCNGTPSKINVYENNNHIAIQ